VQYLALLILVKGLVLRYQIDEVGQIGQWGSGRHGKGVWQRRCRWQCDETSGQHYGGLVPRFRIRIVDDLAQRKASRQGLWRTLDGDRQHGLAERLCPVEFELARC